MSSTRKNKKSRGPTPKPSGRKTKKTNPGTGDLTSESTESDPRLAQETAIKLDPRYATYSKYEDFEWSVMTTPASSINDLVAKKGDRFHFVQIITPETKDSAKFDGEARNNFIQNAFSNGADPIYAHVVFKRTRAGPAAAITFENINTRNRVIIGGKSRAAGPEPADNTESKKE